MRKGKFPAVVGLILYTSEKEWKRYKADADDDDELGTYDEWLESRNLLAARLRSQGIKVTDLKIKFSELRDWLQERNLPNIAKNRARFAAWKLLKEKEAGR